MKDSYPRPIHCLGKYLGTLRSTPGIANSSSTADLGRRAQQGLPAKNCSTFSWFFSFSFVKIRLSYRDNLILQKSRDLTETVVNILSVKSRFHQISAKCCCQAQQTSHSYLKLIRASALLWFSKRLQQGKFSYSHSSCPIKTSLLW